MLYELRRQAREQDREDVVLDIAPDNHLNNLSERRIRFLKKSWYENGD